MINQIKQQIFLILENLKTQGIFTEVHKQAWHTDPLRDLNSYALPCAVMSPFSEMNAEVSTNRSNMRTHTFSVQMIFYVDNTIESDAIDEKVEQVLNAFDNQIFLETTTAFIEPATSSPYFVDGVKDRILVDLHLKVKHEVLLQFGG